MQLAFPLGQTRGKHCLWLPGRASQRNPEQNNPAVTCHHCRCAIALPMGQRQYRSHTISSCLHQQRPLQSPAKFPDAGQHRTIADYSGAYRSQKALLCKNSGRKSPQSQRMPRSYSGLDRPAPIAWFWGRPVLECDRHLRLGKPVASTAAGSQGAHHSTTQSKTILP